MGLYLRFAKESLIRNSVLRIALAVSLFFLGQALLAPASFQVPFRVNGRVYVAARPADAAVLLRNGGFKMSRGNLLDVDGRIIKKGIGPPADIKIGGRLAWGSVKVGRDDIIEFTPSPDITEDVTTTIEDLIEVVRVSGEGEYTVVKSMGAPGKKRVTRGIASGKIVSAKTVVLPEPMRVRLTDTRPEKVIALTFDDGPNPPYTSETITILKDMYATATFFMIGREAARFPETVKEINAAGFQIANHSFSHHRLDTATEESIVQELDAARNLIFPITNKEPTWLRPPYGAQSDLLNEVAQGKGYRVVRWNVDSRDWEASNSDEIVNTVISGAYPGAIVLLHDGGGDRAHTVAALPRIIQALREDQYSFVTLDQLVK